MNRAVLPVALFLVNDNKHIVLGNKVTGYFHQEIEKINKPSHVLGPESYMSAAMTERPL